MKQIWHFSVIFLFGISVGFSQTINDSLQVDSLKLKSIPRFQLDGFVDVFYAYDFNEQATSKRQPFLYNHNRQNAFNLNLAFLTFKVNASRYRINLGLQAGTYVQDNYAAEPDLFQLFNEANVGVALDTSKKWWLDAGIFASHIGFESAVSVDNLNLTRSLLAENSPYFLSGLKVSYQPKKSLQFAGLLTNGWQRIKPVVGNTLPGFGTQATYEPNSNWKINWSSFVGTVDPDSTRRMRIFNNFYGQFTVLKKLTLIAGFDIGIQQKLRKSAAWNTWYSPVLIGNYQLHEKFAIGLRAELYDDRKEVIIPTVQGTGFTVQGYSLNLDYQFYNSFFWRTELRFLQASNSIFQSKSGLSDQSLFFVTSLAYKFSKQLKRRDA